MDTKQPALVPCRVCGQGPRFIRREQANGFQPAGVEIMCPDEHDVILWCAGSDISFAEAEARGIAMWNKRNACLGAHC